MWGFSPGAGWLSPDALERLGATGSGVGRIVFGPIFAIRNHKEVA